MKTDLNKDIAVISLLWIGLGFSYSAFFLGGSAFFLIVSSLISFNFFFLSKVVDGLIYQKGALFFWFIAKFACLMGILLVLWAGRKIQPSNVMVLGVITALVIPVGVSIVQIIRISGKKCEKKKRTDYDEAE